MSLAAPTRRTLLAGLPAALAAPAFAMAPECDRDRLIALVDALEAWQGWEPSNVVAAKAFAAWQMRMALGLDLPDPWLARMHVDCQRQRFDDYCRTRQRQQDLREGRLYDISPMEREV